MASRERVLSRRRRGWPSAARALVLAAFVASAGMLACGTVLELEAGPPQDAGAGSSRDGAPGDPADDAGDGSSLDRDATGDAPRARRVFVTTAVRTGALGGVDGADALCNAEARASGLPGTFVAYLQHEQGAKGHPATRVPDAAFARVDGVRVFDGNPAGATPKSALELTSDAAVVDAGDRVWTGIYGGPSAICGSSAGLWTTTTPALPSAGSGDPHATGGTWSAGTLSGCADGLHLYCFEAN